MVAGPARYPVAAMSSPLVTLPKPGELTPQSRYLVLPFTLTVQVPLTPGATVVVVGATVVLVVVDGVVLYTKNWSMDQYQPPAAPVVSTTARYWAIWVGKLTISGVAVPVQLAIVVHTVPLDDTSMLYPRA